MRRIALSLATLLMGFIIVWLALLAMNITVRLDVLRDPIEAAASRALGRQVRVLGQIEARPTLGPTIVVHDLRIADPGGRKGIDLLLADRVEARLGLIDLLRGKPYITRLLIQDARINLQTRGDGSRNWRTADKRAAVDLAPSLRPPSSRTLAMRQRELKDLSLHDIVLSYRDDRTRQHYQIKLDEVSGNIMPGQPLDLLIHGSIRQEAGVAHLSGGNLSELLASPANWPLEITMDMGGAHLVLNGTLDASQPDQGAALNFELHGERAARRWRLRDAGPAGSFELRPGTHGHGSQIRTLDASGPGIRALRCAAPPHFRRTAVSGIRCGVPVRCRTIPPSLCGRIAEWASGGYTRVAGNR